MFAGMFSHCFLNHGEFLAGLPAEEKNMHDREFRQSLTPDGDWSG